MNKSSSKKKNATSKMGGGIETKYLMGESRSMWNFALCPGWTDVEADCLVMCLKYYGVGKWSSIEKSGRLPTKTIQQMYLQTQRIVGQQSLAAFMGLKLDIVRLGKENGAKPVSIYYEANHFHRVIGKWDFL